MRIILIMKRSNQDIINNTKYCFKCKYRKVYVLYQSSCSDNWGGCTKSTPTCVNVSSDHGGQNEQEQGGGGVNTNTIPI